MRQPPRRRDLPEDDLHDRLAATLPGVPGPQDRVQRLVRHRRSVVQRAAAERRQHDLRPVRAGAVRQLVDHQVLQLGEPDVVPVVPFRLHGLVVAREDQRHVRLGSELARRRDVPRAVALHLRQHLHVLDCHLRVVREHLQDVRQRRHDVRWLSIVVAQLHDAVVVQRAEHRDRLVPRDQRIHVQRQEVVLVVQQRDAVAGRVQRQLAVVWGVHVRRIQPAVRLLLERVEHAQPELHLEQVGQGALQDAAVHVPPVNGLV